MEINVLMFVAPGRRTSVGDVGHSWKTTKMEKRFGK